MSSDKGVVELNEDSFKSLIDKPESASLIMFYAPWCGHCTSAKPEFAKAAKALEYDPNVNFAMINCEDDKNKKFCEHQSIEGFPTIKLFYNGKFVEEYVDENKETKFVNYMKNPPKNPEEAKQASSKLSETAETTWMPHVTYYSAANFSDIGKFDQTVVFFYAPWCPHCQQSKPKYDEAAKKLNSPPKTVLAAMNYFCSKVKIEGYPTVRYYKKGEFWADFEDLITEESIIKFLKNPPKEQQKLMSFSEKYKDSLNEDSLSNSNHGEASIDWKTVLRPKNEEEFSKIAKGVNKVSVVLFYVPWCSFCQKFKPTFIKHSETISKEVPGAQVQLVAIDCEEKAFSSGSLCSTHSDKGYPTLSMFLDGKYKAEIKNREELVSEVKDFAKQLDVKPANHPKDEL
ncbi:hypothetical protein Ciccas_002060 [Cichlidogyrus casuarinus]|uniref:Thioredoxin domain-containing protein n=1 Tax=Cichlidogyrus casuarinus TaxID=1844966 RepID=A0ABD2QIV3_9PLAT